MAEPFVLVQLSDPHIGASWGFADPAVRFAAAVDAVLGMPDRPDAVLVSGDLADGAADAEYEVVAAQLARLRAPVFALAGNHDDRDALRRWFDVPGEPGTPVQYSADLGPLRLVVLDTQRPGEGRGELDDPRLEWLDHELAAAPGQTTLLAMHHPPIATGSAAWDAIGLPPADRLALAAVLERHPQVRRIAAGHVHRTIVSELAGRPVLTVPSTYVQGKLDLGSAEIAVLDEPPGFGVHAVVDGAIASHVQPFRTTDGRPDHR